ncbi:MAG: NADH-quinone oxidoreductase subunit J [Bacteroidota bacterium]
MLETFLFFVFAVLTVVGALGMLISRSPVAAALWMVQVMLAIACLYLTLNAAFIGVVQVLVYAGAIMVLFLFVIMLLNLEEMPSLGDFDWRRVVAGILGVAVLAQLLALVAVQLVGLPGAPTTEEAVAQTDVSNIGVVLLTEHAFTLQIVGVLLLAATIGAVVLAKKRFA